MRKLGVCPLCSHSAHDKNVLAGRAQERTIPTSPVECCKCERKEGCSVPSKVAICLPITISL